MSKELLCKCGCGQGFVPSRIGMMFVNKAHGQRWKNEQRAKNGRRYKGAVSLFPLGTIKKCECGCGEDFATTRPAQTYITGHYTPEVARRKRNETRLNAEISAAIRKKAADDARKALLLRDPAGALQCECRRGPSCGHSNPPLSITEAGCLAIRARALCPMGFVIARKA